MSRPVGFLWSYPGIMALTVPYFDTNDFYFSGHVASTTLFTSEHLSTRSYKMAGIIMFYIVDVWVSLTFLRTHYIADFASGFAVSRVFHRAGETLSYFTDVKITGFPKQKRQAFYYDPCPKCGWGNYCARLLTSQEEIWL